MSDTDGNVDALERALEVFARAAVDRVFFLGGRCGDVDLALARRRSAPREAAPANDADFLAAVKGELARQDAGEDLGGKIVRVASRACAEYASGKAPRKHVDMLDGRICCLVHDKAELTRDDISNASLLFHGNSSRAAVVQIGPRCFVTPGRLRAAADAEPATFGVVDVSPAELVLTVLSRDGTELLEERAALVTQGKMSVR